MSFYRTPERKRRELQVPDAPRKNRRLDGMDPPEKHEHSSKLTTTLTTDIYNRMIEKQDINMLNPLMFKDKVELRRKIKDGYYWLDNLSKKFRKYNIPNEILDISMIYVFKITQYIERKLEADPDILKLILIVCYRLALHMFVTKTKFEIETMIDILRKNSISKYSRNDVIETERDVLIELGWNADIINPKDFLDVFNDIDKLTEQQYNLAKESLRFYIRQYFEYKTEYYKQSIVAMSTFLLWKDDIYSDLPEDLKTLTHFTKEEIDQLERCMLEMD